MASKTFLKDEIAEKDDDIRRLKEVNIAINKKLNEKLLMITKLEREVSNQKGMIEKLSIKRWFEFWR